MDEVKKKLVCPECKNNVDTSAHEELKEDQVIECDKCGINLAITDMGGEEIRTEIVDDKK